MVKKFRSFHLGIIMTYSSVNLAYYAALCNNLREYFVLFVFPHNTLYICSYADNGSRIYVRLPILLIK